MHIKSSVKRYFTVERRNIAYLRFIIESYEGLATLSTVDAKNGLVSLSVPQCFAGEANMLVRALENEIKIKETVFSPGDSEPAECHGERGHNGNA